MARQIGEIQSLPFYQMIGGPLLALVQAQAQAAQTTVEFIEQVGFTPGGQPASGGSIGKLRMVAFEYQKPGPDGSTQAYKVELPLLSLVPIPAMEVKHAEFEFSLKVTDVQSTETKTVLSSPGAEGGDWLSSARTELRGTIGRTQSVTGEKSLDLQMSVKISVGPSDPTAGMAHLYRLFDQAISSTTAGVTPQ